MGSEALIVFFICGLVMVGAGVLASYFLAPSSKNSQKNEPYECGIPTEGPSMMQFKVGYYLFAIMFLIFEEIETSLPEEVSISFSESI